MIDLHALTQRFLTLYDVQPRIFRAPGRVNLIGEHTDYNDGFVLPMAIDRGTVVAGAKRGDRHVRVHSLNFNESAEFDLDRPGGRRRGIWLDYVEGIAQALIRRGLRLTGADLALTSDVAIGGGLSSSAALEMSVGTALLGISGEEMDRVTLALAGQEAEHNYVGMKCGIMDQFIAALGKSEHALLIDCRKLEGTLIPLAIKDMRVVVCDTRVKHALASSEYNNRRAECEEGVAILKESLPGIRALRDVGWTDFDRLQERLPEVVRKRCRHVVSENERTLSAVKALQDGDAAEMGRLMAASHRSLRDDYSVSCKELDVLVESAQSVPGVVGARMTGGGFGGCTVNLVHKDALEQFRETITRDYLIETGNEALVLPVESSDCAAEIVSR
ncbi:MAG TPA: galactokinase [Acidobacteriota bacterium]|nr:galactokinase [Acidobacteriota bacterium]